ncbi:hypothetical protein PAXRUDRAFT_21833 [Paxillus rubicundulus Ve08.2h10]|uniref:Uncharacterized protein n=1 Tax=Paxillus rubicundulus Ve08.2h10 TaxID=930991 RepID=A0A0D0CAH4_9AGAM|nr:hypothetical protein PAXRUDRAFT_21833 [Paxillus rubicundulus Ve08.2h10]
MAVGALREEDSPPINIKRVLCLNNGGLLIELNSTEAAVFKPSLGTNSTSYSSHTSQSPLAWNPLPHSATLS